MKEKILEKYLLELNNPISMNELLVGRKVIIYKEPKELEKGLLRFGTTPKGKAFIFQMPKEEILDFHTVGMKFPIDIYFFNSKKEIVNYYLNVPPGIDHIYSKQPSKYVVEVP